MKPTRKTLIRRAPRRHLARVHDSVSTLSRDLIYIAARLDDGDTSNAELAALGKAAASLVEANRALWEARVKRQRAKGWQPAAVAGVAR